jgi:hypothetical protein
MLPHTLLSGLDRLITVCQRHNLPLKLSPSVASSPQPGELILGKPLDPQLAAVYQRLSTATFGPISFYGPGPDEEGLAARNEWAKGYDDICFEASLTFGQETGFALFLATVPRLADSRGLQPVIYITAHGAALYAVPIASSVDRFFELSSHYLERMAVDPEYLGSHVPLVTFPWDMGDIISRDEPLITQVRAGHFDFLTNDEEGARKWLRALLHPPASPF